MTTLWRAEGMREIKATLAPHYSSRLQSWNAVLFCCCLFMFFQTDLIAFSLRLCPTKFLSDLFLDCTHLLLLSVPGCFCLLTALSALFLFSLMSCSLFPLCLFCLYLSYLFSLNFPLSFPCALLPSWHGYSCLLFDPLVHFVSSHLTCYLILSWLSIAETIQAPQTSVPPHPENLGQQLLWRSPADPCDPGSTHSFLHWKVHWLHWAYRWVLEFASNF